MDIFDYGLKERQIEDNDVNSIARITATHKDRYEIVSNNGNGFAQIKRGAFYDNPDSVYPTTGDFVLIEYNHSGDSMITKTLKRESSFSRNAATSDKNHEMHAQHEQLVASNFDYVFIMQSLNNNFNVNRIERYLSLAWKSGGVPVIILTKRDLVDNVQDYIDEVESIAIGVDVYAVSCVTKEGLEDIQKYFSKGKTIVFLGSSGVGKSTLVNTLYGEEVMKTSEIREYDSRGRHTTTSRNLIMLPNGAMIIDTPGMRELGMWNAEEGISKTFSDIEELTYGCKFSDCTHTNEPGCKVLEAIENGELSRERFDQYIKLQKESQYNTDSEQYLKDKKEKFKKIAKMNRKLFLLLAFILIFQKSYALEFPETDSKSLEVYDITDGKILKETNSKEVSNIASLTKIATVITAIENIEDVDEQVTITWQILNTVDPDASIAGLKAGDKVTYKDLLYASIIPSGADATHSIAILKFGSIENFVAKMNELAQKLDLQNTHFANVTGLQADNHYSTADDIRILLEYSLKNPLFKEVYTTKEYTLSNGLKVKSTLRNYNISDADIEKIKGSKSGYTKEAGYCLSALSDIHGHEILSVTLNAKKDGSKYYNVVDTIKIIDFMNDNYNNQVLLNSGDLIKEIPVSLSDVEVFEVRADSDIIKFLPSDYDKESFKAEYVGLESLDFRNKVGEKIGEVNYYFGDELIKKDDVILNQEFKIDFAKILKEYYYIFIRYSICIYNIDDINI